MSFRRFFRPSPQSEYYYPPRLHPCQICSEPTPRGNYCRRCFDIEGIRLYFRYCERMDKIKNGIQVAKASIHQRHIQYAEIVPMILNVLRLAEQEQDEEKRVAVKCRLEIEASYVEEAVDVLLQQIEVWEQLARNTERQYRSALRVLAMKRTLMIV